MMLRNALRSYALTVTLLLIMTSASLHAVTNTTVVEDFNNLRNWGTRRDADRMALEYTDWHMSIDPNGHSGSCVKLDFTPKQPGSDIWGYAAVKAPAAAIGAWVQNVAGGKVSFALDLVEADGSIYAFPPVPLNTDNQWHYVRFPLKNCSLAPWSKDDDTMLDLPTSQIIAVLSDYPVGQRITVKLDGITVESPELSKTELVAVSLPKSANAGQALKISLKLKPNSPIAQPCEVRLSRSGITAARAKVDTAKLALGKVNAIGPINLKLPERMWPGVYDAELYMPMNALTNHPNNIMGHITISSSKRATPAYTVKQFNGTPQIFEGSKTLPMMGYMYEADNRDQVRLFGNSNVHLYWLETRQMGWVGNNEYDYSLTDSMLADLFDDDPQARVIPFFYVDLAAPMTPPEGDWWQQQLCCDIDGNVFMRYGHQTVSFASEIWRKEASQALAKFVRHLEQSPYADRIVGYHPSAGGSYEWMYHGGQDNKYLDYSQPMQKRFRSWLKSRYLTDAKLQAAWNNSSVTLASASIPTPSERMKSDNGSIRDPKTEQSVIDYTEFLSLLTADTIDTFCAVIKRETNYKKITGVFYGYVQEQFYGGGCTQNTGHFGLGGLLRSPNVDYLMSPTSYYNRQAGGTGGYMSAIGSVRLHNKVWIDQADIRTHLSDPASGFGRVDTEQQAIGVLRREWAMYTAAGSPVYWYCFSLPWYTKSPSLLAEVKKMASLTVNAQNTNSPLNGNRLAVIVSDSVSPYTNYQVDPMQSAVYIQREALHRAGVPFDVYLDSDLGNPAMPKYKAYLFLDSLHLSPNTVNWINTNLKSDQRVLAWVWAPGICDGSINIDNSSKLTGISLQLNNTRGMVTVQPRDGQSYGSSNAFSPIILPVDTQVELIGTVTSPADLAGRPGVVLKKYPNWSSIYSAAPHLSTDMIRTIAKQAGIPVYSVDDQPIYIGPNTIGLHGSQTATREVKLPYAANVTDAFTGKSIGRGVTNIRLQVPQYDTVVLQVTKSQK